MSSASGPNDERPLQRARLQSDVAVPEQSAVAPTPPSWTLDTNVEVVLLRGAAPPADMKLSAFLTGIGEDIVPTRDVSMRLCICDPADYIQNNRQRERVLISQEFMLYELFYKVAPFLEGKAISSLRQWAESGRGVRPSPSDNIRDHIWNVATARLDAAVDSIKRDMPNEAALVQQVSLEERVETIVKEMLGLSIQPSTTSVKVIPGAFESVVNARWSHVLSGEAGMPLGMRVVDGLPENVWSYAEVNHSPSPLEVDREVPRSGNLEIMVLSSEAGWPYTQFRNETRSVDNNAGVGRGGVFNAQRSEDVYIRREVVRVWYIVEEQTRAWYVEGTLVKPKSFVVVGTPGIGKSFACGSFLLYQLLHYKNKLLDVVAYFIRDSAYVIHNARPGVPGRVVKYSDQRAAVLKINWMAYCKRGFVIVDISKKGQVPPEELPTKFWPAVVLTSPDVKHYDSWVKDRGGIMVIVNCDDERDLVAFVAWRVLRGLPDKTEDNAGLWLDAEKILKEQLEVLNKRIQTVGPLPRFVLDDDKTFKQRETQVIAMLNGINENNRANYKDILSCKMNWQNDDVTHKLVKIMRVRFKTNGEDTFQCRALSFPIFSRLYKLMLVYLKRDAAAKMLIMSPEETVASLFEEYSFYALLQKEVLYSVSYMMKYLRREGEGRDVVSVLEGLHLNQLDLRGVEILPTARQRPIAECRYMVMYKPCIPNYPVVDAFFFVEGHPHTQRNGEKDADGRVKGEVWRGSNAVGEDARRPKKTIVMVQVTTSDKHPTSTTALVSFQKTIARNFAEWDTFSENLRWEMIYVNCPGMGIINERQVCEDADEVNRSADGAMAERKNAAKLWEGIHQWQVTISDSMSKDLALAQEEKAKSFISSLIGSEGAKETSKE
ncbi:retrotransposon hot spot (RHS) protein, putative [Trypanosoma vivax Y486]|uniref:Retrotransposon hot spot (RHS) protein, putative n=1 Tax=Trypanosoma vivax (strain Y486) TaxID=1055687 RepID=F9WKU0_TRYVY|nr:retrotransposon hot spot (RHS) protein, putative [Trypanosoma vivax Y486]|eukprot:CCD18117.1 retrotransposon hot spot (RHS) protein, putative [Trypanosoma vivax Y486]